MILKDILDEDFVNYKKASMYIAFPYCTFKCEKDCGIKCCQNSSMVQQKNMECDPDKIIKRYVDNEITHAIVCCGLEPLDSFNDVVTLLDLLRNKYHCNDDFVIYTGYKEEEVEDKVKQLSQYPNVIMKFGRFVPNQESRYDEVMGINLATPNQYGKKIS